MLNQLKNKSGLFKDKSWEIALLGVAVLVFIFNSLASPYFFGPVESVRCDL